MAIADPVDGGIVSAAWGDQITDAINLLLNPPIFEGRQTVAQTLTTGSGTAITLDAEDLDNYNGHSPSSNTSRYVIPLTGRYQLSGGVGFTPNGTGTRAAYWCKNGIFILGSKQEIGTAAGSVIRILANTMTVLLNAGDYIELFGLQGSGANLTTDVANSALSGQATVSIRWVAPV